jgi:hypothetical protein
MAIMPVIINRRKMFGPNISEECWVTKQAFVARAEQSDDCRVVASQGIYLVLSSVACR